MKAFLTDGGSGCRYFRAVLRAGRARLRRAVELADADGRVADAALVTGAGARAGGSSSPGPPRATVALRGVAAGCVLGAVATAGLGSPGITASCRAGGAWACPAGAPDGCGDGAPEAGDGA